MKKLTLFNKIATDMLHIYLIMFQTLPYNLQDPEVYNEEYDKRIFRLLNAASMGDIDEIKRFVNICLCYSH